MDLRKAFLCCVLWTFTHDCLSMEADVAFAKNASNYESIALPTSPSLTSPTSFTIDTDGHHTNKMEKRLIPDEQVLLEKLLDSYHKYSRPVINASEVVIVRFGLTLVQISDMDEVNQVLTLNVWLEQEWVDERLTWNPKDYNNLKVLRMPCEKLWLPDIVLYNSADDFTTGYMNSKAMVTYNGSVFWPPPAKFRSSCTIDITYFPFDDQICELKFGSWTYDGFQVDITNRSALVDLENYVLSGEWELIKVGLKRTEVTYACCIEPYPDVRFTIVIRRKTLFYLFNIIFPCLWLTILSLLGFWLPPDSGEKITLGITVLLAFSVFMLLIAESMPATSDFVPLIGIYLTVTMGMTSLSIILTVFVLQLHHVGPHQKPVPLWLRTIIFEFLAKVVCMCYASRALKKELHAPSQSKRHELINTPATYSSPDNNTAGSESVGCMSGTVYSWQQRPHPIGSTVAGSITPNCNGQVNKCTKGTSSKTSSVHILQQREPVKYPAWGSNSPVSSPEGRRQTQNSNVVNHNFSNRATESQNLRTEDQTSRVVSHSTNNSDCFQKNVHDSGSRFNSTQATYHHIHNLPRDSHNTASSFNTTPSHQWWNNVTIARNSIAVASGYEIDPLEQAEAEWKFVAHVMDRLLFWLFLLVAFVSSLAILVIKPLLKPQSYDMEGLYDAK